MALYIKDGSPHAFRRFGYTGAVIRNMRSNLRKEYLVGLETRLKELTKQRDLKGLLRLLEGATRVISWREIEFYYNNYFSHFRDEEFVQHSLYENVKSRIQYVNNSNHAKAMFCFLLPLLINDKKSTCEFVMQDVKIIITSPDGGYSINIETIRGTRDA